MIISGIHNLGHDVQLSLSQGAKNGWHVVVKHFDLAWGVKPTIRHGIDLVKV